MVKVVDQWASAFDELLDIVKPFGVSRDNVAAKNWIRKHIHDFRDNMTEEKYAKSLQLISIIHK
jgi:hypothetical protein